MTDELDERLAVARDAAEAAGAALLRLPRGLRAEERGDQLKTAADRASEGWVLGYLEACFAGERVLAEEQFDARGEAWDAPPRYWTIDALDGTRSFAEGFAGFCVQIAYVADGTPRVAVVHEPALAQTYVAIADRGAYRATNDGAPLQRLRVAAWPDPPRLVDSTRPSGAPGAWMQRHRAAFVELGSIGLKICRVADGTADVFAKRLAFKLWDVAPGALVLAEAGGRIGLWDGAPIALDTPVVRCRDLVATAADRFDETIRELNASS